MSSPHHSEQRIFWRLTPYSSAAGTDLYSGGAQFASRRGLRLYLLNCRGFPRLSDYLQNPTM
jgi:hypothetical protein